MSHHNIPKAEIATVQIGHFEFEGLYCADLEQFGVAVPQICSLFLFPTKHSSRDIKTILGDGFQVSK